MSDLVEQLLNGVVMDPGFENLAHETTVNPDWNFMETTNPLLDAERDSEADKTLLGFGVSGWQLGSDEVAMEFRTRTLLFNIPGDMLTIDRQGKGTGARLYNTAQALAGAEERAKRIGLYAFTVNNRAIYDRRRKIDSNPIGKALRVGNHIGLTVSAWLFNPFNAASVVNNHLGEAEAVIYNQTVAGERQKKQDNAPSSPTDEALLVYRRSRRDGCGFYIGGLLKRVGVYPVE